MFDQIPTEDPQEALRFTRALKSLVEVPEPSSLPTLIPEISVVLPVYNEVGNLPELYQRLDEILSGLGCGYEILFVDDGSHDGSLELLQAKAEIDPNVLVIELARNFGHQVAISAGLDYARGKGVVIMDSDLQDPPEVLPQFIDKWREGHDVVYAIRQVRKENWFKRTSYKYFYRALQRIANIKIPIDSGDFCLMDRKVVDLLSTLPERNRFVRGIRSWVGLNQVGLGYERHERFAGRSKYTFTRLIYLALDGLVSFSFVPLRVISLIGFGISALSVGLAIFYAIKRVVSGLTPPGFATTIVAIFFLAGVQLVTMGVIGEYVGRIFEEVKQRPLYVIRRVINGGR